LCEVLSIMKLQEHPLIREIGRERWIKELLCELLGQEAIMILEIRRERILVERVVLREGSKSLGKAGVELDE
ncbi:hypothetical protein, partial [Halarchaeum acidiphilum]